TAYGIRHTAYGIRHTAYGKTEQKVYWASTRHLAQAQKTLGPFSNPRVLPIQRDKGNDLN
ncbi:hypothetical protein, partial [Acetobacter orientalis]|uniref:hypothetical protein n=1 Tax=Acetobacter orientalis TaxID=146474 RepID=UPI0039EBA3C9